MLLGGCVGVGGGVGWWGVEGCSEGGGWGRKRDRDNETLGSGDHYLATTLVALSNLMQKKRLFDHMTLSASRKQT